jgi:transposase
MRPKGSAEELERRRMRALALLGQGKTPVEVARLLDVDRRTVRRWKATARDDGSAGLRAQPAAGRPPRLEPKARRRLVLALIRGYWDAGLPEAPWTCAKVARLIEEACGVRYDRAHVCRLLGRLGFRLEIPARFSVPKEQEGVPVWVSTLERAPR